MTRAERVAVMITESDDYLRIKSDRRLQLHRDRESGHQLNEVERAQVLKSIARRWIKTGLLNFSE